MKKTKKGSQPKKRGTPSENAEAKRVEAYYRWQKRGSPMGDEMTDWAAVERRWKEEEDEEWGPDERAQFEENPRDEEPGEAP